MIGITVFGIPRHIRPINVSSDHRFVSIHFVLSIRSSKPPVSDPVKQVD